jgi:hypothetical protein
MSSKPGRQPVKQQYSAEDIANFKNASYLVQHMRVAHIVNLRRGCRFGPKSLQGVCQTFISKPACVLAEVVWPEAVDRRSARSCALSEVTRAVYEWTATKVR